MMGKDTTFTQTEQEPRTLLWVSGALELTRNRFTSCLRRFFFFHPLASPSQIDLQPIVHLGTLSGAKLVFFPTYPGAVGHSGGGESGALSKFLDTILALGQFTILSRVRRFRVRGPSELSLPVAVITSKYSRKVKRELKYIDT